MRRFIKSLPGKAVGQLVVMALLLPTLTLLLIGKAQAQLTTQPTWAVLPFVINPKGAPGMANLGNLAADAVATELSKTNLYDVVPQEQVKRAAENLGLTLPLTDPTSVLRLAQEVRASTIVTGEVVGYRILNNGGKQAVIAMNTNVIDVASGLAINGAGVTARSTVRAGSIDNDTIVGDAISAAASQAVSTIRSQTLPTGTVLNTTEETALINQGTRTGFKKGQRVVIVRGREEVAVGTVVDVEPDQAYVHADRVIKGVQPQDRVRVIFDYPPVISLDMGGNAKVEHNTGKHSSAGFVQVLLLVALGAFLFGGGRGKSDSGATGLMAQAEMFPDPTGVPSVYLHWNTDIFHRGSSSNVAWQIWRSDVPDSPVLVVQGTQLKAHDVSNLNHQIGNFSSLAGFNNVTGGATCNVTAVPNDSPIAVDAVGPAPGHAYQYRIELVYKISALDLPDGTTGASTTGSTTGTSSGTTGTTGGTTGGGTTGGGTTGTTGGTTGGGTTSGTTGTAGSTGGTECYFLSQQTFATGLASPLVRSQGQAPPNNASLAKQVVYDNTTFTITFQFSSANTAGANLTLEYVVEESLSPTFPKGGTKLAHIPTGSSVATLVTNATSTVSLTTNNDLFQDIAQGTTIFWRVGVRNVADSPGPVPDSAGNQYIVGPTSQFTRAATPPPPPGIRH